MIMDEVATGNLTALIARSADFYGPNTPLSFMNVMVLENQASGVALNDERRTVHQSVGRKGRFRRFAGAYDALQ